MPEEMLSSTLIVAIPFSADDTFMLHKDIEDERVELLTILRVAFSSETRCVSADSTVEQGALSSLHPFLSVFKKEAYTLGDRRK